MVKKGRWLSMRHFLTNEYLNNTFMGQQQCPICNTNIKTNGLIENLSECTIFASTLMRSKQTVDYVISTYPQIDFKVIFSNNLIERGLGDFEGNRKVDIRRNYEEFFSNGSFLVEKTPPNGESLFDFRSRVSEIVKIMINENRYTNILVISHLQVLRMIHFCMIDSINYSQWHNINYLHGEIVRENYGEE